MMKTHKVVLDTNVLIGAGKGKFDIFEVLQKFTGSYEVLVPSFIKDELEKKSKRKSAVARAARFTLNNFLKKMKVVEAEKTGGVDSSLIRFTQAHSAEICTNDKKLCYRAREKNIIVWYIGLKKYPKSSRTKVL